MNRILRLTVAMLLGVAVALCLATPAAAAGSHDAGTDRPLMNHWLDWLFDPVAAWFAGAQQDGGPNNDPDGLAAVAAGADGDQDGGPDSDLNGFADPPPGHGADGDDDGGSQIDPDG